MLPQSKFLHLRLAPLNTDLALEYSDKWATARRLRDNVRLSVRETLRQRISSPHMAELARNTMQLSILLNLIYQHGESLPSKRTEMYNEYVNLFFSREVEKSDIVREYRQLLERLHRFLGWHLHSQAEDSRATGRASEAKLRFLLEEFLVSVGQPTSVER